MSLTPATSRIVRRRGRRLYPLTVPAPGSAAALDMYCSCPVHQNYAGQYLPPGGWVIDLGCVVHTADDVQWSARLGHPPAAEQAALARRRTPLEGAA